MKNSIRRFIPCVNYLGLIKMRANTLLVSDEKFIKNRYRETFKKDLNVDNPKTFNEKIQYRILKDRKKIYTKLTDKYIVRGYVESKIGKKYLTQLYGVYESTKEINYENLPNKFVLKCTHDCGSVIICTDKSQIDSNYINKKLKYWLKRNYYYATREYHYKDIKPRIICEEFIGINNEPPVDYKFHVFNGKNKKIFIQCDEGRFGNHTRSIYDECWNKIDVKYNKSISQNIIEKPQNLEEMIFIAKKLSEEFDYVRVDLYSVEDKIYFGELTFTPAGGMGVFEPEEWDIKWGNLWDLKK